MPPSVGAYGPSHIGVHQIIFGLDEEAVRIEFLCVVVKIIGAEPDRAARTDLELVGDRRVQCVVRNPRHARPRAVAEDDAYPAGRGQHVEWTA
jgi:hypothetical protein